MRGHLVGNLAIFAQRLEKVKLAGLAAWVTLVEHGYRFNELEIDALLPAVRAVGSSCSLS